MTPWEESSTLYGLNGFTFAKQCKAKAIDVDSVRQTYYPIHKWAIQNFGKDPTRWRFQSGGLYFFRDEQDAMLFMLRWS
jgi:hypothetical protein